jgi:ribosomal protein S18 acetylase RimI-like enzyme
MIRAAREKDENDVVKIASATELFDSDQVIFFRDMFRKTSLDGKDGSPFWLLYAETQDVSGVVYCEPEPMTNGTWNIQFIGVYPNHQNNGIGGKLLQAAEQTMRNQAARIVIVETAGISIFEYVRKFYISKGYERESTIRDFYEDGVDKVIFRKYLR